MSHELSTVGATTPVRLQGEWTIQRARELKELLTDRLSVQRVLALDLRDVSEIDVAALQLICSAHQTAQMRGGDIFISSPLSSTIEEALHIGGFSQRLSCNLYEKNPCLLGRGDRG